MSSLLKIDGMSVTFATPRGNLRAVNDVTIELLKGESLGVVGESGSGKTVLSRATMGLLPGTATRTGTITYNGKVISELPKDEVRELWGTGMAMIFQDPMTALNPVRRIGSQLTESLTVRLGMDKKAAKLSDEDKETVEAEIKKAQEWLEENPKASKDEFDETQKAMEKVVGPIFSKLYQGGKPSGEEGGSGGSDSSDDSDEL